MKIQTNTDSSFPNQVVSDEVKASYDYGLQVSRAIEQEWFNQGRGNGNRYLNNWNSFHTLRLYARGEQSIQKYKDELSINGDLSYLNLDWKPIPVISKFVDIVVNGMSNKSYDISAFAQDPFSVKQRTDYAAAVERDMNTKEALVNIKENLGMDFSLTGSLESLPENQEELDVHLQMTTKQNVEIAEEEVINNVLAFNKYDQTKKRLAQDLTTIGIGAVKTSFNKSEGIVTDYVDPANMIYSYTEDPNFEDIYYVGEVKSISLAELKKQFPSLSASELEKIQDMPGNSQYVTNWGNYDANTIQVLYFEYKTYSNQVYKIKELASGASINEEDGGLDRIRKIIKDDVLVDQFKGMELAKKTVLFNGLTEVTPAVYNDGKKVEELAQYNHRSGYSTSSNICLPTVAGTTSPSPPRAPRLFLATQPLPCIPTTNAIRNSSARW